MGSKFSKIFPVSPWHFRESSALITSYLFTYLTPRTRSHYFKEHDEPGSDFFLFFNFIFLERILVLEKHLHLVSKQHFKKMVWTGLRIKSYLVNYRFASIDNEA